MAEFESYRSLHDFSKSITREWRYTRSAEQEQFLSTLLATSHSRKEQISEGAVIAESFRYAGIDGLAYRSSLGDGHNIALFDLDAADVTACGLFQVRSVKFTSIAVSNPYFVDPSPSAT
jgi:hypothetical protein